MSKRDINHIQKIVNKEAAREPYGRSYNEVAADLELVKFAKHNYYRSEVGKEELRQLKLKAKKKEDESNNKA